ncbi:pentapeptide repeat-containing protein [Paenibacillus sp. NPDC058174]|uniref:pentapeptide repeat-containing protein n=1 Tax=Paenibacillus sp. NPDC058174 TaxID=3346366 RepID=UPI0036DB7323
MKLWQQFLEHEVLPLRNAKIRELHSFYISNKREIAEGIVSLFDILCKQIKLEQERGELSACSSMHLSLMRTRLMQGDPAYLLHLSDQHGKTNSLISGIMYDAGWIFQYMDQWFVECEISRRRYMNKIDHAELQVWLTRELYPFHVYMVHAVRYAMDAITLLDSFQNIRKDIQFEVRVGEYGDSEVTESVYRINEMQRSSITCKGWLESRVPNEYIYEHIAGVNLIQGEYEQLDFNYARFEKAVITGSRMKGARLLGTRFERCRCEHVDYTMTLLYDADFRESDLTGASFDGALGGRDAFVEAHGLFYGMNGVRFQGASLNHASFKYAKIAGDFTGAQLEETDFTGADLTGSRMLARDRLHVNLTPEQQASVEWEAG